MDMVYFPGDGYLPLPLIWQRNNLLHNKKKDEAVRSHLYEKLEANQRIIDGNPDLQFLEQCYTENIDEIIRCRQMASKCSGFKLLSELYNSKATLVSTINETIYEEFENSGAVPSCEIMQEIREVESVCSLESYPPSTFDEDRNHYAGVITKKPSGTSLA